MPDSIGQLGLDLSSFTKNITEGDKQLAKFDQAISDVDKKLKSLDKQLAHSGSLSSAQAKSVKAQQMALRELSIVLTRGRDDVLKAAVAQDDAGEKTDSFSKRLSGLRSAWGLLKFAGIGIIVGFAKSMLSYGAATHDAALVTRTASEAFQRVTFALSKSGVSAEHAQGALHGIADAMAQARAGSVEADEKLKQLGISFDDIRNKTPDQVFLEIADSIRGATNDEDSLRKLTALFGADLARLLLPALKQGGDGLKNLGSQATVTGSEMTDAANQGEKALQRWGTSIKQWALESIAAIAGVRAEMKPFDMGKPAQPGEVTRLPGQQGAPRGVSTTAGTQPSAVSAQDQQRRDVQKYLDELAARGKGRQGYDKPIGPQLPPKGPADVERDYLKNEQAIAKEIAPQLVKEKQRLVNEEQKLTAQLGFAIGIEKEQLKTQLAQNKEAQRANALQSGMLIASIRVSRVQATLTRGYEGQNKLLDAQINAAKAEYQVARQYADVSAMTNALMKQRTAEMAKEQAAFDYRRQHAEAEQTLDIMEKQMSGQAMAASIAETRMGYEQRIAQAIFMQDKALVAIIQKQERLAQMHILAEFGMRTPQQRHAELMQEQGFNVAVGRGQSRMGELQNRANRGVRLSRGQQRELDAYNESIEVRKNIGTEQSAADMAAKDASSNRDKFYSSGLTKLEEIATNTKDMYANKP